MGMREVGTGALLMVAIVGMAPERVAGQQWSWPERAENLQNLPADFPPQRLSAVMRGFTNPCSMPELANALQVSQRTLYRAFRESAGVGPDEYYRIHKLHHFRECLLASEGHRGDIAQAAELAGFDHLSRLAQSYRKHFGELPSETLARRRGSPT